MRYAILMMGVLASSAAVADTDARFAKLRDNAEALTSLAGFVERYVGSCGPAVTGGAECEKNAEVFRKGATGKKYYMIVVEESTAVLQMGEAIEDGFT